MFEETQGRWRWQARKDLEPDGSFKARTSQYYEDNMVACVENARAAGMPVERMQRSHRELRGETPSRRNDEP